MRLVLLLLLAMPVAAADLELGMRHLSMSPMGGEVDIVSSRGFAATAEVFWTPRISTQLAGTFVNPAAFIHNANLDLGTFGIDTYSLTARYHVRPDARWSAFAGAGPALVIFGNLEDRFGDDIEMTFDRETALLVEGGVRYRVFPSVYVDAAVSYMPVEATPNHVRNETNIALPDVVKVDPLTISAGASWRF
ncbi:MAG: OmpW family outer membrane protein [Thermoanaerobaculia bacterium]